VLVSEVNEDPAAAEVPDGAGSAPGGRALVRTRAEDVPGGSVLLAEVSFARWSEARVAAAPAPSDLLLGVLGAAAILWDGLSALRSERVKQLVAYSTVAQLGLLFLLVPMAGAGSTEAWIGGIFQGIAHALPKAALLLAAALLARTMGGDTVTHLAGAVTRRPLAVFALGLSGLSLIGLPPTGGFVAKWYLLVGSIRTGQWWWASVIVVGSLLTAAYLARVIQACFAPAPVGAAATSSAAPVRGGADVIALTLAATSFLIGLYPDTLVALVQVGTPLGELRHG
jgi:multicomponent Na+:H+ antiporter subunit D